MVRYFFAVVSHFKLPSYAFVYLIFNADIMYKKWKVKHTYNYYANVSCKKMILCNKIKF